MNTSTYQPSLTVQEQSNLIARWQEAKKTAAEWSKLELELRKEIDQKLFDPEMPAGTSNLPMADGYRLKLTRKTNYNINTKKFDAISHELDEAIRERITSIKYNLQMKEYNLLIEKADSGDQHAMAQLEKLEQAITSSKATPTVELVAPKEKS